MTESLRSGNLAARWAGIEGSIPLLGQPSERDPERNSFTRGDHRIDLFRWVRPDAMRVLLVHGIGMGHIVYDRFISEIEQHVDVTAVDLPGFGETPEPEEPLSMEATADLLAEAIRAQDLSPVVAIGHSMGSQVVSELAARHPELVDRVVLIAPTVNAAERSALAQAGRMLQDLSQGEPMAVMVRGVISYMQTGLRWYLKKLGPTLAHRLELTLPRIAQPTLVMRGTDDRVSPRGWAVRLTGLLPRGEMRQLESRGHEALIASGKPAADHVLDWCRSASE